jgi:hypothetical protein
MRLFLIVIAAFVLSACAPSVEKTEEKDAQALVDSFTYVRAKSGLCFGIGTTSRLSSSGSVAYAVVVVPVDCKSVNK